MYARLVGGRSGKFGLAVYKASMFDCEGRSSSKSAKFGVTTFKASDSRSAKFGVAVFKTCMLDWWGLDLASLV